MNNLRDIDTDRKAGKRTLAVLLGRRGAKLEYTFLLAGAYLFLLGMWLLDAVGFWGLLPLLSLPLSITLLKRIWQGAAAGELNKLLASTANLALIFSLLLSAGLIAGA